MNEIRPTAVAGAFYPADPVVLKRNVDDLLAQASGTSARLPKVIIAPHAGYVYSGPLAAQCYAPLAKFRNKFERVVLLGPSHRVAFRGIAAPTSTGFATPLGVVPIDSEAISKILKLDNTGFLDDAHAEEHSLEVHLPFLQTVLGNFKLVPLVVGDAGSEQVANVLDSLWGDEATLIVISTDLSHFHSYDESRHRDRLTADKILQFDANLLGEEACGCRPLNGLLKLAQLKHLNISEIGINNSGDTGGDKQRVVGYGGYHLYESVPETIPEPLNDITRQQIIHVARQAIYHRLTSSEALRLEPALFDPKLRENGACFITLKQHGELRGCIGSLEAHRVLLLDVAQNAQAAAFKDPRFAPITGADYAQMTLEASVLSKPVSLGNLTLDECLAEIIPKTDGIIISEAGKRATYLPTVWEQLPEPIDFLRSLRHKAGLPPDQWNNCEVWRYSTESFE